MSNSADVATTDFITWHIYTYLNVYMAKAAKSLCHKPGKCIPTNWTHVPYRRELWRMFQKLAGVWDFPNNLLTNANKFKLVFGTLNINEGKLCHIFFQV